MLLYMAYCVPRRKLFSSSALPCQVVKYLGSTYRAWNGTALTAQQHIPAFAAGMNLVLFRDTPPYRCRERCTPEPQFSCQGGKRRAFKEPWSV